MEKTIRNTTIRHTIQLIHEALDRMGEEACEKITMEATDEERVKTFWRYAEPILEIANVLDRAGMLTKGDGEWA